MVCSPRWRVFVLEWQLSTSHSTTSDMTHRSHPHHPRPKTGRLQTLAPKSRWDARPPSRNNCPRNEVLSLSPPSLSLLAQHLSLFILWPLTPHPPYHQGRGKQTQRITLKRLHPVLAYFTLHCNTTIHRIAKKKVQQNIAVLGSKEREREKDSILPAYHTWDVRFANCTWNYPQVDHTTPAEGWLQGKPIPSPPLGGQGSVARLWSCKQTLRTCLGMQRLLGINRTQSLGNK